MKPLVVILAIGYASWHYTSLTSENVFSSIIFPIILFFSIISLGIWLVVKGGANGKTSPSDTGSSYSSGDFGGGDGGGE